MDMFQVLGDPTRRALLHALASGPREATQLAGAFPISQPAVSRHLKVLREAGVVTFAGHGTDGRKRMYSLRVEPLRDIDAWLRVFWQGKLDAFGTYAAEQS